MTPHPLQTLADILPPGHRSVVHELVLLDGPAWKEWSFLAAPVRGFGGVAVLRAGEAFPFSTKYGTRIYAFAQGEVPPAELTETWKAAHSSAAPPVDEVAFVPVLSSLNRIVHTLSIEEVGAGTLRLALAGDERDHSWPPFLTWLVLVLLVAAGLLGYLRLRRRRAAEGA